MLSAVHEFIAENRLIKHGESILLAVSGGVDSMVMAHLFLHMPFKKAIAHCNFSLRGDESDDDQMFVEQFSSENNIIFHTIRFPTREYAAEKGLSIQMAARELRYSWFEQVRKEHGYDLVAVAHNRNDNAETLIFNLARGTGPAGLSGMKPKFGNIIRPILFASREAINEYCLLHNIRYREDRSNSDTKYTRNKIRHLVIPVLGEINPSIVDTLAESAGRFSEVNEILNRFISDLREKVSVKNGDTTVINLSLLKGYLGNRTILFGLFRPFGTGSHQIDDLLQLIAGKTGGRLFTGTHRLIKNRDEIIISGEKSAEEDTIIIKDINEIRKFPGLISAEKLIPGENFRIPSDPSMACLDSGKLTFPLIVRKWKAGDYFFPLGMTQKKKLSDYFIDRKYSIPVKENKMILESDGRIVWIIGDRIDDRFKITMQTTETLIITVKSG